MAKDRGWGSRPIGGQDWGTSASCESTALNELIIRFERSLSLNGTLTLFHSFTKLPQYLIVTSYLRNIRPNSIKRRISPSIG